MEDKVEDHTGYIYLLQTRGDVCQGNDIYKIGSAKIYEKRINHYDNYATVYAVYKVNHYKGVEQTLIFLFNTHFTKEIECGKEYFHGNVFEMMGLIEKFFMSFKVYFIEKVSLFSEFKNDRILHHIIYNDENTNKKFYHYIENIKRIHGIEVNKANFREYMKFFEKYIYRQKYNIDYENYMEPEPESEEEKLKNEVMNHESEKYEIESNYSDDEESEEDDEVMNREDNIQLPVVVYESQPIVKKVIKRKQTTKRNETEYSNIIIKEPITYYICHHCCSYYTTSKSDLKKHFKRITKCKKVIEMDENILYQSSIIQKYIFSIDINKLKHPDLIFIVKKYSDKINMIDHYFRDNIVSETQTNNQAESISQQPSKKKHILDIYYNESINRYVCNECTSQFETRQGLERHIGNKNCEKRKNIIELIKTKEELNKKLLEKEKLLRSKKE